MTNNRFYIVIDGHRQMLPPRLRKGTPWTCDRGPLEWYAKEMNIAPDEIKEATQAELVRWGGGDK